MRTWKTHGKLLVSALSVMASAGCVGHSGHQATDVAPPLSQANYLVDHLTHGKLQAVNVFRGPDGLWGVVTQPVGVKIPPYMPKGQIVWTTPDGKALIPGPVLNAHGADLTQVYMNKERLLPTPMPAKIVYEEAANPKFADSFVVGNPGAPEIVAIVDPNCIFCHVFYQEIMPAVAGGKVRVRFVMAGFLKPTSRTKAAAILSSKDPAKAYALDEKGFDTQSEEGGIAPDENPSGQVVQDVARNTAYLASTGQVATPTIVYQAKSGRYHLVHGLDPHLGISKFVGNLYLQK